MRINLPYFCYLLLIDCSTIPVDIDNFNDLKSMILMSVTTYALEYCVTVCFLRCVRKFVAGLISSDAR